MINTESEETPEKTEEVIDKPISDVSEVSHEIEESLREEVEKVINKELHVDKYPRWKSEEYGTEEKQKEYAKSLIKTMEKIERLLNYAVEGNLIEDIDNYENKEAVLKDFLNIISTISTTGHPIKENKNSFSQNLVLLGEELQKKEVVNNLEDVLSTFSSYDKYFLDVAFEFGYAFALAKTKEKIEEHFKAKKIDEDIKNKQKIEYEEKERLRAQKLRDLNQTKEKWSRLIENQKH